MYIHFLKIQVYTVGELSHARPTSQIYQRIYLTHDLTVTSTNLSTKTYLCVFAVIRSFHMKIVFQMYKY